jgi:hypothetical protein
VWPSVDGRTWSKYQSIARKSNESVANQLNVSDNAGTLHMFPKTFRVRPSDTSLHQNPGPTTMSPRLKSTVAVACENSSIGTEVEGK